MTDKMTKLDRWLEKAMVVFLYIFAVFMPFKIAVTQSSLGLAVLCWVLRITVTKGARLRTIRLEWAFGVFIAAVLIALPFSSNIMESIVFLKRLLLLLVVYVLTATSGRMKKHLIYIFAVSLTLYSVTGILSFIANPETRVRHIQNSMTAGGITMIGALVALALAVMLRKRTWRIVFAGMSLINFICLILTSTRGSWLGFFAGALLILYLTNRKLIIAVVALIPLIYFLGPDAFAHRVRHIFDPTWGTNAKRIAWWSVGWEIFKDHPIVGVGDVSTQQVYKQYALPGTAELVGHFHSNYVHIAVTLGSIGLLAFLFMAGSVLVRLFAQLKYTLQQGAPPLQNARIVAALAVFFAFLINGFFEWNYGDAEILTMVWFVVGLAIPGTDVPEQHS